MDRPLNILGIYVTHDQRESLELNYQPLIQKAKNLVEVWKMRNLTIMGKIQVLNTLTASLFVYRMMVLPCMPKEYCDRLKKIFVDFIWDGKKAKILYKLLIG